MLNVLSELCALPGVSGDEGAVREYILAALEGVCKTEVDALGNIIAYKNGRSRAKNKIMVAAHMDEVGFIITHFEDKGLLHFSAVGGIDSRIVVGKSLRIGPGGLPGVVGVRAVHMQSKDERDKPMGFDKLFIDIGAASREEAMQHLSLGDRAVFASEYMQFGEGYIRGRALDDRAGCALLLELLKSDCEYDFVGVFTVMEETGCQGALAAANRLEPDISVVLECTTASDIPGVPPEKQVCALGAGPVLSFMDRGTVYDRELYGLALALAERHGIPCQIKAGVYGSNDSRSIQTSGAGVRAVALSLPCRYLHSPSCVIKGRDLTDALNLMSILLPEAASL